MQIEGNTTAGDTNNRDRLTINDNNRGFVRDLNYDYLDTAGDLDILANSAGNGLAGGNNASMLVNVRTMETIVFNSADTNDLVRVTGTSSDDDMTVALRPNTALTSAQNSAAVFLNGNPYGKRLVSLRPAIRWPGTCPAWRALPATARTC